MNEIVEFVRARIAEDEELAREVESDARHGRDVPAEEADHVAVTGVARVLADCEAKRGLLELAEAAAADGLPRYEGAILRRLAQPYAEHADYLDAWRP
ncbi:DUF6221 family protein [Nocardioides sp. zg-DK7169]|uniref:DUF6221 family protein n=1 Tax=Nocardioides sp. zg-DK7169 TaxID=2736600 RepID=UPI0015535B3B|nr:DUF6221 family protein [Nocardioides sp. zg-DK7169]NPC96536.1 hypothetical protein [Nocardioides sp. zg-DK7169]